MKGEDRFSRVGRRARAGRGNEHVSLSDLRFATERGGAAWTARREPKDAALCRNTVELVAEASCAAPKRGQNGHMQSSDTRSR